jgi:starch-binding outer membrane protein, SusD/RagB family
MKNKNIFSKRLMVGTLSISLLFAACTDLETDEKDSLVIKTSGGTFAGDAGALLASTYNDLGALTDQANVYALSEQPTDEMIPPTRGVDWGDNGVWRTLHQHTWDPTHSQVLESWNQLNQRAFKCNQILASTSPAPSAGQIAEAKFLRAFFMFQVMDLYGKVPFREVTEGVDVDPKVLTRSEAFDFIVADLEAALSNLPVKGPAAKNGQASRAAANLLLARLYLNKAVYKAGSPEGPYTFDAADMNKVIAYVDDITDDGYSLQPNYFDNFTPSASTELIFTSPSGSAQNRIYMTLHYNQNPSGWNGFTTLADFYGKFDGSDSRKAAPSPVGVVGDPYHGLKRGFLVGPQVDDNDNPIIDNRTQLPLSFTEDVPLSGAATNKGIRIIKYHPGAQGDYIFLRYADALLMKAEAIHRGGTGTAGPGGTTALGVINFLRGVRGATVLAGPTTDAMILDERGRELYWEGVRRTDQIRFGTYTGTWHEKTSTETFRVLFPIPQQAIDSNPNLKQNKGYPGYVGE